MGLVDMLPIPGVYWGKVADFNLPSGGTSHRTLAIQKEEARHTGTWRIHVALKIVGQRGNNKEAAYAGRSLVPHSQGR